MRQLAVVQFFTWLGLFCMWLFFVPATARHVFGATDAQSDLYTRGIEWGGLVMAFYSITCFVVALVLPRLAARFSRKAVHAAALLCGAAGLLSCRADPRPVPAAAGHVRRGHRLGLHPVHAVRHPLRRACRPQRMGVYMGVFNFFIVLPEITAAL